MFSFYFFDQRFFVLSLIILQFIHGVQNFHDIFNSLDYFHLNFFLFTHLIQLLFVFPLLNFVRIDSLLFSLNIGMDGSSHITDINSIADRSHGKRRKRLDGLVKLEYVFIRIHIPKFSYVIFTDRNKIVRVFYKRHLKHCRLVSKN